MIFFEPMATVLSPGRIGCAELRHLVITDGGGFGARLRGEGTKNGTYAALYIRQCLVMSDTDMEQRSHLAPIWNAQGDVLIGGLGLGMVALALAKRPVVRSVTIIEKEPDVIALIEPPLQAWAATYLAQMVKVKDLSGRTSKGPRHFAPITVVEADAFTWTPPGKKRRQFDYVWLDIWPDICADDLREHAVLRKRYSGFLRAGGKVDSWQYERLRRYLDGGRGLWE